MKAGRRGKPNIFITLTCNPANYETPDEAARDMKRAFVLLRRRVFKRYRVKNLPFMVVFEKTKKGWPHMHVLARAKWIDQTWLSLQMKELIDAPIVDVRSIQDQGRAAAYVSKYVGKDPHVFSGCKRWWRSHNYEVEKEEKEPFLRFSHEWFTSSESVGEYLHRCCRFGWEIEEQTSSYARFRWRTN